MSNFSSTTPESLDLSHLPVADDSAFMSDVWAQGRNERLFVGQETARAELVEYLLTAPEGAIATVEAPFGTGKSTLLYSVFNNLSEQGDLDRAIYGFPANDHNYDESADLDNLKYYPPVCKQPDNPSKLPVLYIEEIGRSSEDNLKDVARTVNELRESNKVGRIILTGDDTLRDERFLSLLNMSVLTNIWNLCVEL